MNTRDEEKVLKDGETLHTSMTFMDAQQQAVAEALTPITDKPFVSDHHKPRFGFVDEAQRASASERQAD